jgi:hypothetical protein
LGEAVESSRRSLAHESHSTGMMRDEQHRFAKGATSIATVIAQSLQWTAGIRQDDPLKRILVVEPRTRSIGMALRAAGVPGETIALIRTPLPRELGIAQGYDRCVTYDWLSLMDETTTPASTPASTPAPGAATDAMFDAVIVSDLTRILSPDRLAEALTLIAAHINPLGYLILAEPAHVIDSVQLTRDLIASGLELMMDPETVADDWPRIVMTWRRRTPSEAMRSGVAHRIDWKRLAHDRVLQGQLAAAYQEVFGGEEWCEWVKCVRPGCERQYSHEQTLALQPPNRCVCGWHEPLVPFHPPEVVLASVYQDLIPSDSSCAYFRFDDAETTDEGLMVGGFAWGYLTDPYRLARTLIPVAPRDPDAIARTQLAHTFTSLLRQEHRRDNPAVIYYHSILGVLKQTRSLSLTRYLFERGLHFARERGAKVVILRTSVRSQVFPLLTGLGMRPVYWYAGDQQPERWQEIRTPKALAQLEHGELGRPFPVDERVVLSGQISALLGIFSTHSDFRLAGRIARGLRAARSESGQP